MIIAQKYHFHIKKLQLHKVYYKRAHNNGALNFLFSENELEKLDAFFSRYSEIYINFVQSDVYTSDVTESFSCITKNKLLKSIKKFEKNVNVVYDMYNKKIT